MAQTLHGGTVMGKGDTMNKNRWRRAYMRKAQAGRSSHGVRSVDIIINGTPVLLHGMMVAGAPLEAVGIIANWWAEVVDEWDSLDDAEQEMVATLFGDGMHIIDAIAATKRLLY